MNYRFRIDLNIILHVRKSSKLSKWEEHKSENPGRILIKKKDLDDRNISNENEVEK